ncbi:DUF222 domain-containing protein [Gordonia shandongensis]|uniref:DUF222 domain-containing protein n=1 Tax=Gordonia shandongensis TaxID=376351 RepID=UPI0012EC20D5|nr:DUF222 domain-containing protein [Gordonia shandongensis]
MSDLDSISMDAKPEPELPDDPGSLVAVLEAAAAKLTATGWTPVTETSLLVAAHTLQRVRRRLDAAAADVVVEVSDRGAFRTAGYLSVHQYLAQGLRMGGGAARRQRVTAQAIGSFTGISGQTLEPARPATAAAVADGAIGTEHVMVIDEICQRIPTAVTPETRAQAEADLAAAARDLTPEGIRLVGVRLLAHLDPDGQLTDDADRHRLRSLVVGGQDRQLMSRLHARMTPVLRAELGVVLQGWAALGMNNPDDPASPAGPESAADPTALAAAAQRDRRGLAQRQHDALLALVRAGRAQTGTLDGSLRSELVITITDVNHIHHAEFLGDTAGRHPPPRRTRSDVE